MVKQLKAAELFLSLGLVASLVAGCSAPKETAPNTATEASALTEGGEGGEGGEGDEGEMSKSLNWANRFDNQAAIAAFTEKVVIPNYVQYASRTAALAQAIDQFAAAPNEATLAAARKAWSKTRLSWETTETFAFGPAGSLGFDGAMDSWPVNRTDIENILSGEEPITTERVAQLQGTEKGMHAIEYLLFGPEASKKLAEFSDRETDLLSALGQDLNQSADALLASWQEGIEGQPAYKTVFASAGNADNPVYPTTAAAAQELVSGIIDSLSEVGEEKLAAPFAAQDTQGLESRFSAQTMNDLKSNLQSAENGYLGALPTENSQAAESISTYVAAVDPALDEKVKAEFAAASSALSAVPTPLEQHLTSPAAKSEIERAIASILTVKATLENEVVPLI